MLNSASSPAAWAPLTPRGVAAFARARLANAGVNICLGTDSLASMRKFGRRQPELDMFAEMRALGDRDKALSPSEIIRMATVNGARHRFCSDQCRRAFLAAERIPTHLDR